MSNFQAKTRLRGEVTFHLANWIDNYFDQRKYGVRFMEGEHSGEIHHEDECAIITSEKHKLEQERDGK